MKPPPEKCKQCGKRVRFKLDSANVLGLCTPCFKAMQEKIELERKAKISSFLTKWQPDTLPFRTLPFRDDPSAVYWYRIYKADAATLVQISRDVLRVPGIEKFVRGVARRIVRKEWLNS